MFSGVGGGVSQGWRKANDRTDPQPCVSGLTWPSAAPARGGCGQQCPSPGPCGWPLWVPGPLREWFLAPHLGGEQGQFCPPGPETLCSASTLQLFFSSKSSLRGDCYVVKIFSCVWGGVTTATPLCVPVLKPGVTVHLGAVQVPACSPGCVRNRTAQARSRRARPGLRSWHTCSACGAVRPSVRLSTLPPQRLVCLALVLCPVWTLPVIPPSGCLSGTLLW